METINKKMRLLIFVFWGLISCKAQIYLSSSTSEILKSHLETTNNDLQSFVGTYSSVYNGNLITLYINIENNKSFNFGTKKIYRDVLSVRYIIKNSSRVLQSTKDIMFSDENPIHAIYGLWVTENKKITLKYYGTNCNVGQGKIILKKINTTQLSWEYRPDKIKTASQKCIDNSDTTIYLPETKDLIFTQNLTPTFAF